MNYHMWSLNETINALSNKTCSAEELTRALIERIAQHNPKLHAFISVSETAIDEAKKVDQLRATNPTSLGPLAGVPISLKDLIDTTSLPTTYGGNHYKNYFSLQNATVVKKLTDAGAIILGKTNLHEYAYGTTNENSHHGNLLNPWNRAKIAGGSSGGSAVSLAAGLATASIGTDTGGSIRIPAALTGIVGLKPTFGLVSRNGVFPLAESLDHVGPMTKTVADAALLLQVIRGYDPTDRHSIVAGQSPLTGRRVGRPIRVGIPKQFFFDKCHPGVLQTVLATIRVLETSFIQTIEIDIPHIDLVPEMQHVILATEALNVHQEQLKSEPQLYGARERQRLETARDIRSVEYMRALKFKDTFRQDVSLLFDEVDVILTPTTPLLATDVGQMKAHLGIQEVPIGSHLTRYTNPWNLSGLPAISIPCGLSSGLPVGLQLVGGPFSERKLLAIAEDISKVIQWTPIAPDYR